MNLIGVHPVIVKLIDRLGEIEPQAPDAADTRQAILLEAFETMGAMAALGLSTAAFVEVFNTTNPKDLRNEQPDDSAHDSRPGDSSSA